MPAGQPLPFIAQYIVTVSTLAVGFGKGYQCTTAVCSAGGTGALGWVPYVLVIGVDREICPVCVGAFATFASTFSQPGGGPDTVAAQSPVFLPRRCLQLPV